MSFVSIEFSVFLIITLCIYYICPKKLRSFALLAASYYFYIQNDMVYAIIPFVMTGVIYISGFLMEKYQSKKKAILITSVILCCLTLFLFKYSSFIFSKIGMGSLFENLILPVGISFFTFRGIGYLIDTYNNPEGREHNYISLSLFVCFFPMLLEGPIEKAKYFLPQIREMNQRRLFSFETLFDGVTLMIFGYFVKMVIADRVAVFSDYIFDDFYNQGSVMLVLGALAYSIQIYTDFLAYTMIALGIAKIMGINLTDNFNTPYFSRSIKDFWGRWHISLSTWLKDYIYIPLGGSRRGKMRTYLNLMITFVISGIWHGSGMRYIIWGLLHGIYQVIGRLTGPSKQKITRKLNWKVESFGYKLLQTVVTFILVTISWILFRVQSVSDFFRFIKGIFTRPDFARVSEYGIYCEGFEKRDFWFLVTGILILIIVSILRYKKNMRIEELLKMQPCIFRMIILLGFVALILLFGEYGLGTFTQPFVYIQF